MLPRMSRRLYVVDSKERDVIAKLQAPGDAADVDPSKKELGWYAPPISRGGPEACSAKRRRARHCGCPCLYRGCR